MAEGYDPTSLVNYLPPEILQIIFEFLPANSLIRCRQVNSMWRSVVDSMSINEKMWRRHCKEDFAHVYEAARKKSNPRLGWFNLYRSISFWKLLKDATGIHEELCSTQPNEEIRNFKILDDGIIGVLKKGCIVYYDSKTLDLSHRPQMLGDYTKYIETENVIVVLNNSLHLFVIRKVMKNEIDSSTITFYNVKLFTLAGDQLYFVNLNDEIFVMSWRREKLHADFLLSSLRGIMTIGYSEGNLNVLTAQREIYSIENQTDFVRRGTLGSGCNLIHQLQKYQLLENIDWRIYFQWMYMWHQAIPVSMLRDMYVIKQYGDIFFVGSHSGVLRIYYAPVAKGGLDIFNRKPMRQFNLIERNNAAAIWCPILNIDVIERNDGHTVFVALPQKIVVLKLKHKLGRKTFRKNSLPMLPDISEVPEEAAGPSGTKDRRRGKKNPAKK